MSKLSQIKLGNTTYDIGTAWGNITGKPTEFPPASHTHNYAGSSSAGGPASTVAVTQTTPSSATTYYLHYSTGVSGSQTTRANTDLYYYDTGSSSYFNVGSSSNIGGLTLHYNNGYYVNLITDAVTANRDIKLPNANGTIALTNHNHDSTYLKLSGGTLTGLLNAHGGISLNSSTSQAAGAPEYILGIKAFAEGGNVIWQNKANVSVGYADSAGTCTSLSSSAGSATKAIYFSGGKPAQCNDTLNHNISGYSASLAYSAQITTDANIDGFLEANRFKVGTWNSTSSPGVSNGIILSGGWTSTNYGFQIAIDDDPTYFLALRQKDSSGWKAWKQIPMADGTGASGTWGINVTGSAGSVAWGNVTGKPSSYTPSSHTHSYAGSGSAGGAANSANILNINGAANLSGCVQYIQQSSQTSGNDLPTAAWWHVLKMNHGTGDTYYKRLLAFDFFSNKIMTTYKNGESTDHTTRWKQVWVQGDSVTGAVWNDYAECRESDCNDFGYVLKENGDDSLSKTEERLSHFAGVSSDTWGFSQGETDKAKTPIAVAGRVLAYPYQDRNNYKPGDCVCAAPGGTVDIMTREEVREWPDRIVGTVSCVPDYEEWGGGEGADRDPVKVNGRIWIKVK